MHDHVIAGLLKVGRSERLVRLGQLDSSDDHTGKGASSGQVTKPSGISHPAGMRPARLGTGARALRSSAAPGARRPAGGSPRPGSGGDHPASLGWQLAFLGPAGHGLGRNLQDGGHLSGPQVARKLGCDLAAGLGCRGALLHAAGPDPNAGPHAGPPDGAVCVWPRQQGVASHAGGTTNTKIMQTPRVATIA
jgi:hypothetical protein